MFFNVFICFSPWRYAQLLFKLILTTYLTICLYIFKMCTPKVIGLADSCQADDVCAMRTYVEMARRAGALPLVLPATDQREEAERQLQAVDMLLLLGGGDIAAERFGATPLATDGEPNLLRDAYELLLMDVAVEKHIPILGICRGMQLINVYFGGTLWQDLNSQWVQPDTMPSAIGGGMAMPLIEHSRPDKKWEPVHSISIDSQSRLSKILHCQHAEVNSTHHQAVHTLGQGLRAVAWSEDGVVEALESELYPILAVQFHPERLVNQEVAFERILSFTPRTSSCTPNDKHRS